MTDYRGLTWDHPRGTVALRHAAATFSAARDHPDTLTWDAQPLEGFESHPIDELCARHDLVVLDHPHLGDALAADCLRPLEEVLPPHLVDEWSRRSVGRSGPSYEVDGRHWAAPLDAATQVAAAHRAHLDTLPTTWDEVVSLAERRPVALSLAGPHALLTFSSLCVALGEPPATEPGHPLVSPATGLAAWKLLRELFVRTDPGTASLNPIALLGLLAEGKRLSYCPLVYGYVTYSSREEGAPVLFGDAPRAYPDGPLGSVLGGTGLAVSRRAEVSPALAAHLADLMSAETHRTLIPAHRGQPARVEAWTDPEVNRAAGDFYRATLATTRAAWVRPRHPGFPALQLALSRVVREGLLADRPAEEVLEDLLSTYRHGVRPAPAPR
ncbi:carbohydrate ABC transporter substrate-binding protein [Streptomyces sp. NPDC005438]|uniref:carbohydrate ABC transporter substrate-binding protein n=1 Tax=Streptomyces sp. NPDC005438 TaxID=3156880 RepID=UPI0033A5277E